MENDNEDPNDALPDRVNDLANYLYDEGKTDDLEEELLKFNLEDLEENERESWHHFYGISAFQKKNHQLAYERFLEGSKQFPDSATILFSLGQEYEYRGEIDKMIDCFNRSMYPKVFDDFSMRAAHYAYLWDRLDSAKKYVEVFLPYYYQLKILDTNFLKMRDLPFFEQVWDYLAAFSYLRKNFTEISNITIKVESECSDFNFKSLKEKLELLKLEDITEMNKYFQSIKEENGYTQMRMNFLLAQSVTIEEEALQLIDKNELSENDFQWPENIRLLAKCEVASRFGNQKLEKQFQTEFFKRQPQLVEPDLALDFFLLDYQEKLKKIYQKGKLQLKD